MILMSQAALRFQTKKAEFRIMKGFHAPVIAMTC